MVKSLLIVTQKVDESDANLGFFVRWIEEFAKRAPRVIAICLEEGKHHLPVNVSVRSLGKERNNFPACAEARLNDTVGQAASAGRQLSRLRQGFGGQAISPPANRRAGNFQSIFNVPIFRRLKYAGRFLKYLWQERHSYDGVFIHMNPEYALLGGALWRLLGKPVGFWYTHQSARLLRSALPLVQYVFTPARESFPLRTEKVQVVGHGIDTELFIPKAGKSLGHPPVILSDTRITPSKHVEQTLELSKELMKRGVAHAVQIIGAAITEKDKEYEKQLLERAQNERIPVSFVGGVPFASVPNYYGKADIFINHANVGALNKTVLQAMAMNLPVVTSNEAYRGILPDAVIVQENPAVFADAIQAYLKHPFEVSYRERILKEHSLQALIPNILRYYA